MNSIESEVKSWSDRWVVYRQQGGRRTGGVQAAGRQTDGWCTGGVQLAGRQTDGWCTGSREADGRVVYR